MARLNRVQRLGPAPFVPPVLVMSVRVYAGDATFPGTSVGANQDVTGRALGPDRPETTRCVLKCGAVPRVCDALRPMSGCAPANRVRP
jgi:hypothetical protein